MKQIQFILKNIFMVSPSNPITDIKEYVRRLFKKSSASNCRVSNPAQAIVDGKKYRVVAEPLMDSETQNWILILQDTANKSTSMYWSDRLADHILLKKNMIVTAQLKKSGEPVTWIM
jgi:hypothetical protein